MVACAGAGDPQFAGMRRALEVLEAAGHVPVLRWEGGRLGFPSARAPGALVLAGHGCEETAGVGDGTGRRIGPAMLAVPAEARLYLLACSQGRADLRAAWARGTGRPLSRVQGAEAETETLLSTLFVLHLAREGPAPLARLFRQWVLANRIIRPHFPAARALYAETGGDPLAVLAWLERTADLAPVRCFLGLAGSSTEYLSGLVPVPPA